MTSTTLLGIALLVVGGILVVSELHTFTIYLIAIAVACFASAGTTFAGGGLTLSLAVLAAVTLLGMPVAHWARVRLKNRAADEVAQNDVGHMVTVLETADGALRVQYRGSAWNARLADLAGPPPRPGQAFSITAREGSVLVLGPPRRPAA